jgi:hypothetical protein
MPQKKNVKEQAGEMILLDVEREMANPALRSRPAAVLDLFRRA